VGTAGDLEAGTATAVASVEDDYANDGYKLVQQNHGRAK